MPQLVCLSLPTPDVERRLKLPPDAATAEWCQAWRTEFLDTAETLCFLCDDVVSAPPRLLILPDHVEPQNRLLVPLCPPCCALPTQVKYARTLKIIRAMYKAMTGKRLHLTFNPPMHRHPR
jgi:hypothetical protein